MLYTVFFSGTKDSSARSERNFRSLCRCITDVHYCRAFWNELAEVFARLGALLPNREEARHVTPSELASTPMSELERTTAPTSKDSTNGSITRALQRSETVKLSLAGYCCALATDIVRVTPHARVVLESLDWNAAEFVVVFYHALACLHRQEDLSSCPGEEFQISGKSLPYCKNRIDGQSGAARLRDDLTWSATVNLEDKLANCTFRKLFTDENEYTSAMQEAVYDNHSDIAFRRQFPILKNALQGGVNLDGVLAKGTENRLTSELTERLQEVQALEHAGRELLAWLPGKAPTNQPITMRGESQDASTPAFSSAPTTPA
ncbi:MAG: hypothetical protein ACKVY0_15120 [Prosthecobacter sp.]|uniref:hypothetical protein n=1 Tax=Prosthecobacter sp. TaxID=1965333 RepID=UPI0039006418